MILTGEFPISAAHARWEEIALGDVAPVIELMKELSRPTSDKGPRQPHSLVRSGWKAVIPDFRAS